LIFKTPGLSSSINSRKTSSSVNAFNGVSIGKGHLAQARAAINVNGGGCGSGDTAQRDQLLAKIGRKTEG